MFVIKSSLDTPQLGWGEESEFAEGEAVDRIGKSWYKGGVAIRRTKHAVYELKYHLVWVPKYRAHILGGEVTQYLKGIFRQIAEEYDFQIEAMEVMADHVHVFIEAPPSYSPSEIVQVLKSISAKEVFKKYPRMRKIMWSGKMWNEGYYVRSVGDKVTSEVIKKYIKYQKYEDKDSQLRMFEKG